MSNLRFSSMYVYYSLDREGFIEQLCENKDKPELNCNGQCMLMQMLRAQAEDDEPMPVIGWEEVLVFFMDLPAYNLPNDTEEANNAFYYKDSYSYRFSDTLIKPPMI
jgi:imidazoleglycerol phosphate synthase glutamine amidotransferase subunit HisH